MLRIGQVEPSATADGKYTDGSVAGGIAATRLRAAAFNAMQEELANIVESAGMILSPDDMTQVLTALKKQLLSRANPFADIKADGPAAVAAALSNLGLGEGSALPVGVPVPWPSATPPTGWLKCNGAPFAAEEYPELAKAYPTNKLPDLRGEFIRGWDDGRGIDAGREILSAQGDAIRNITGTFGNGRTGANAAISFNMASGVFVTQSETRNTIGNTTVIPDTTNNPHLVNFDASRVVPTASENRPRNIAFNFIVRAA